jgi:hypothetical protein
VALCDVTSATNTRTVLATLVPPQWRCGNTAPILRFEDERLAYAGLAVLNSMTFDWMARRVVGGLHLNRFYLERLSWPRLTESALERLAAAGLSMALRSPRGGVAAGATPASGEFNGVSRAAVLAEIEYQVALGYELAAEDLERMFSANRGDRRGLWRFFETSADGRTAAALAMESLRCRCPPIAERLAA